MPLSKQEWLALEKKAHELRRLCLDTTYWAGSGHIGGGMSVMDMLTVLYHKYMRLDVKNPKWEDRDRFILSKGHAGIAYAPVLVDFGWNDPEQLKTFNHTNSKMGIHLDSNKVVGVGRSTGSLFLVTTMAIGTALAAGIPRQGLQRHHTSSATGGCGEGSKPTICPSTSKSCVVITSAATSMIDGRTEDVMKLEPFADKWRSFGFIVKEVDGHNFKELCDAIDFALENKTDSPVMIIADTIKGAGINFMEDNYQWHYGAIDEEKYKKAIDSLDAYYEARKARAEKEGE